MFVALIMCATVALAAQDVPDKPDFSGRWTLDSPRPSPQSEPTIPLSLTVQQTVVRTNVYGASMKPFFRDITIERQFATGTQTDTHVIGVIGGAVPGSPPNGGPTEPQTHYATMWEGDSLVIETGSHTGSRPGTGVWTAHREVWAFDPDGRLRVVIAGRGSDQPTTEVTLLYRR